jgi:polysaccharide pyruvyl transferase WcaK-like protein
MKITIIGWYGTETIGDRGILAGLISIFSQTYDDFEIKLGSLYPFFSERTIFEDQSIYEELTGKKITLEIFNVKNYIDLNKSIKDSELVVMGGGPLMDLSELFMVEYAFSLAKKNRIKTAVLGCGVGPLFQKKFKKSVLNIIKKSDLVILRDNQSKINLTNIAKEFQKVLKETNIHVSTDPAVECCVKYRKNSEILQRNDILASQKNYIAVNLRSFPVDYSESDLGDLVNNQLIIFIKKLAEKYSDREIRLIPMSYFHLGCDDREFLNQIIFKEKLPNVTVQNKPLTLKNTMKIFQNSYFNIGMRFHSVVFQTILSGNNYILDYTEPRKGKIYGFIKDISKGDFYNTRYIVLQDGNNVEFEDMEQNIDKAFSFNDKNIENLLSIYVRELKLLDERT